MIYKPEKMYDRMHDKVWSNVARDANKVKSH